MKQNETQSPPPPPPGNPAEPTEGQFPLPDGATATQVAPVPGGPAPSATPETDPPPAEAADPDGDDDDELPLGEDGQVDWKQAFRRRGARMKRQLAGQAVLQRRLDQLYGLVQAGRVSPSQEPPPPAEPAPPPDPLTDPVGAMRYVQEQNERLREEIEALRGGVGETLARQQAERAWETTAQMADQAGFGEFGDDYQRALDGLSAALTRFQQFAGLPAPAAARAATQSIQQIVMGAVRQGLPPHRAVMEAWRAMQASGGGNPAGPGQSGKPGVQAPPKSPAQDRLDAIRQAQPLSRSAQQPGGASGGGARGLPTASEIARMTADEWDRFVEGVELADPG